MILDFVFAREISLNLCVPKHRTWKDLWLDAILRVVKVFEIANTFNNQ